MVNSSARNIDFRLTALTEALPNIPFAVVEKVILEYMDSSFDVHAFPSVAKERGILCTIIMIFLSVVTFGGWNHIQTKRFWKAVQQEREEQSSERRGIALGKMHSALKWGADLSPCKKIDFVQLVTSGNQTLLGFLAAQIDPELEEEDPILQQFCYYLTDHPLAAGYLGSVVRIETPRQELLKIVERHVEIKNIKDSYTDYFYLVINRHHEKEGCSEFGVKHVQEKRDAKAFDHAVKAFASRVRA